VFFTRPVDILDFIGFKIN